MKATSYVVGFKDTASAKTLYFGPFVSESVADFFIAALPEPQKGGWVRIVQLQPFLAHEARTVAQMIERQREKNPIHGRSFVQHNP